MQTLKLGVLFGWIVVFSCAQKPAEGTDKVKWTTLEEVETSMQKEKRPILIDLYADWCGWCKVMEKKTYSNKNVVSYLGQKFYTAKLNTEGNIDITWKGKKYSYNAGNKLHDFALYITNGQLQSLPTTVVIPVDGEPQVIPGYLATGEFEIIAKYFGEGNFGKVAFDDYQKKFKSSW